MKNMITLTIMAALFSGAFCSAQKVDNVPILTRVDLGRYLGRWYEVARYDHSFEKGLTNATAEYTLREDGKVSVVNSGWKNGKVKTSTGKAKLTDNSALLRVSFFGPFYSDYRILMLSPDYRFALIGSSSPKYLWILSRTPVMSETDLSAVLKEAVHRGYDTSKLIWVNQISNIEKL